METNFGKICLEVISPTALAEFDDADCLRIAIRLRLPIKLDDKLPIPICATARNPAHGSAYSDFRIHTVRDVIGCAAEVSQYRADDDPFDAKFGDPYFGLYGMGKNGLLEHIADRPTYSDAVELAQKLAPGVEFQITSIFPDRPRRR